MKFLDHSFIFFIVTLFIYVMISFDNEIQSVIEERQSILFEVEKTIFTKRYSLSTKHKDIFSAQSISTIYSVWEGFVQIAFGLYIDEINKEKFEIHELCDEIIIYHMESSFRQFQEYPQKSTKKSKFFLDLKTFYSSDQTQEISKIVNTESNVSFDVLNKLLEKFSLEKFPEHWGPYTHPHSNLKETMNLLLKLRNEVAHRGKLDSYKIDQSLYSRFRILVIDIMYEVREKMLDGLRNQTFKK